MNTQQLLLPFIENIDYRLEAGEIIPLPKTRKAIQVISHPEVQEIKGQKASKIIAATFDASGNELTPMIPAQKYIKSVAYRAAYEEEVEVDETYFENVPSISNLKVFATKDVALAVSEFLSDKNHLLDPEEDSINIVENRIHSWNFANIPQPSTDELFNAYYAALAKQASAEEKAAALKYLQDTDYKIIKAMELGTAVAPEILAARSAARLKLQ